MENIEISNHTQLVLRIQQIKAEKIRQEEELKIAMKGFVNNFNSVSIVKEYLHSLASDKEVQFDLAKVGLNIGANFIIDRVLGKNRSIVGFLSSLVAEKLSASFINDNFSKIISGIGKIIHPEPEQEIDRE